MTRKKHQPENKKLRNWRENKRYLQREVAEMIGVARSTYIGYESNTRVPTAYALLELSRILDVPANELYESFDKSDGYIPLSNTFEQKMKEVIGCL